MKNMKIYDADHDAIKAFRGTGLELVVVALLNGYLQAMSANDDQAMNWIKENVQHSFLIHSSVGFVRAMKY